MPLFYQQHINQHAKLAIWKIEEDEDFFVQFVQASKQINNKLKRLQHLAARYLLQLLEPEFKNSIVEVSPANKPFYPNNKFHFSVSHCGHFAAGIISKEKNVAIDIELISSKVNIIKHKFLVEDEVDLMDKLVIEKDFTELPTLLWSIKETMYKYHGLGSVDFKRMLKIDFDTLFDEQVKTVIMDEEVVELNIGYKVFEGLVLSYGV